MKEQEITPEEVKHISDRYTDAEWIAMANQFVLNPANQSLDVTCLRLSLTIARYHANQTLTDSARQHLTNILLTHWSRI
jgi:hypothetical protein